MNYKIVSTIIHYSDGIVGIALISFLVVSFLRQEWRKVTV